VIAHLGEPKADGHKPSLFDMAQNLQRTSGLGKVQKAAEIAKAAVASGKKVLIFAHHVAVQHALIHEFPDCARLLGESEDKEAELDIERFQKDLTCTVFVASLLAAHLGLTLTAASVVIMVEYGWVPAENDQAEGRSHRKGQTQEVHVYYLVGRDTIDERMFAVLAKKRDIADMVNTGSIHEDVMRYELKKLGKGPLFAESLEDATKTKKAKHKRKQTVYHDFYGPQD